MVFETFTAFFSRVFCFTSYVGSGGSFPRPLSPSEECEYVIAMANGDMAARETLIKHNLRLVAHIVKKYSGAGEADDLISVGSIGLIKGVESFEYGKGSQLATYVARCIENEILMYIRANKKHRAAVSLLDPMGSDKDGNEITLMEVLPDERSGKDFEDVENSAVMERVRVAAKKVLTPRERRIMEMRYALFGGDAQTQNEVASKMGISRSYVSRIEKKAIEKLRKVLF